MRVRGRRVKALWLFLNNHNDRSKEMIFLKLSITASLLAILVVGGSYGAESVSTSDVFHRLSTDFTAASEALDVNIIGKAERVKERSKAWLAVILREPLTGSDLRPIGRKIPLLVEGHWKNPAAVLEKAKVAPLGDGFVCKSQIAGRDVTVFEGTAFLIINVRPQQGARQLMNAQDRLELVFEFAEKIFRKQLTEKRAWKPQLVGSNEFFLYGSIFPGGSSMLKGGELAVAAGMCPIVSVEFQTDGSHIRFVVLKNLRSKGSRDIGGLDSRFDSAVYEAITSPVAE